jgi:glyoxylase I family protein
MAIITKGMTPLLQVYDMPTSMDFYCKTLGFEVGAVDDPKKAPHHDWVWLKRGDDIDLMLNTAYESDQRPAQPDAKRVAAHDDVCLYFGAPDVDAVYHDLAAKGLKLNPPKVAWYGMKQLTLHDPDGYAICFQWKAEPDKK